MSATAGPNGGAPAASIPGVSVDAAWTVVVDDTNQLLVSVGMDSTGSTSGTANFSANSAV
jgi:hypothetical protein